MASHTSGDARVVAALRRLEAAGCPAAATGGEPDEHRRLAGLLVRRCASVGRRHRRVDDRARFLDLIRGLADADRAFEADCVAEAAMAALGHPMPGMRRHG